MIAWVHGRSGHRGPHAQPAAAACLPARLVFVLDVTDLTDGGLAVHMDAAQLARRHSYDCVIAFLREQLRRGACRSHQLAAATKGQLDVMDGRPNRDARQRDRIADAYRGFRAALDRIADLQSERRQDVALLAVLVVDERDARAAVRVVLDGRDLARHVVLVPLEVDLPVELAVAAALVTRGDPALVVAAGVRRDRFDKALLGLLRGDLVEARDRHEAPSRGGGLELAKRHQATVPNKPSIF